MVINTTFYYVNIFQKYKIVQNWIDIEAFDQYYDTMVHRWSSG